MSNLKRIASLTILLLALFVTSCFATAGTVNAPNGLILREEASKSGKIITTISDNTNVEVTEESGDWYKVKYKNYNGYVFAEYVELEEPIEQEEQNTNTEEASNNEEETLVENPDENTNTEQQIYPQNKTVKQALKVYIIPSVTSKVIANVEKDATITINYELNNWVNITSGSITGWARKYFINMETNVEKESDSKTEKQEETTTEKPVENKTGYINASSSANVRAKATTESSIITILTRNTAVTITGEEGDFYKIEYKDYKGYISKDLISEKPVEVTSRSGVTRTEKKVNSEQKVEKEEVSSSNSSAGDKIVNFAKKYIGYDYTWGGSTPSKGFDCSGFVYYVYNSCGYSINRTCTTQAKQGKSVSKSNLQKGDLVFFDNGSNGSIGHVGIYIGGGKIIHAENKKTGVRTDTINSGYYNKYYYSARRIIK